MAERTFSLGGSERERIEVSVQRYERPPSGEYFDDNWLSVRVSVCVGGFRGRFDASFQTGEIASFRDQLSSLYKTLKGEAKFVTMETQLALTLIGDGRGGITLKGEAWDQPGTGNRLEFALELDQTHVGNTLGELNEVLDGFPVRAG